MNTKDERFHALLSTRTFLIVLRIQKKVELFDNTIF